MKILKLIILVFILHSCNQKIKNKEKCQTYLKELKLLKDYSKNNKDTTYVLKDIKKKITSMENFTGIKIINQGDWLGKHEVKQEDVEAWERWFNKHCK